MFISSEIGSQWRTILGHTQLIECMGICILSLAHGSEQRGSDFICIYYEKLIWKIFFKFNQGMYPWMAFAWIFFRDFSDFFFFLGGSVGQIIYREYIVFRGSNISCSLASRGEGCTR